MQPLNYPKFTLLQKPLVLLLIESHVGDNQQGLFLSILAVMSLEVQIRKMSNFQTQVLKKVLHIIPVRLLLVVVLHIYAVPLRLEQVVFLLVVNFPTFWGYLKSYLHHHQLVAMSLQELVLQIHHNWYSLRFKEVAIQSHFHEVNLQGFPLKMHLHLIPQGVLQVFQSKDFLDCIMNSLLNLQYSHQSWIHYSLHLHFH